MIPPFALNRYGDDITILKFDGKIINSHDKKTGEKTIFLA